ncbi:MAG TPA: hypothetical protein VG738_04520 [Chitinophagaceae bacterium]|nr:hypothetical protein [Chitinophagaceae bacterium]
MLQQIGQFLKRPFIPAGILGLVFTAILVYYYNYHYKFDYGDMAMRVEGAKLIKEGRNAYYYGSPGKIDSVTGVVSTPFLNFFHMPLSGLDHCTIKDITFWMEFVLMAACLVLTFWVTRNPLKRYVQCGVVILFFLVPRYWYFNVSIGQIYILYTLLIFVLYLLVVKKRYFIYGIVLAISIAFRPLFVVPGLILLLFYFNKNSLKGLLVGGIALLLFTLATKTFGDWLEYNAAMKYYTAQTPFALKANGVVFNEHFIAGSKTYSDCKMDNSKSGFYYLGKGKNFGSILNSQVIVIKYLGIVAVNSLPYLLFLFAALFSVVFFAKRKFPALTPHKYAMLFFLLYILTEIIMPAPRGNYNFILWLFASALIVARGSYGEILLIIAGLLLNNNKPFVINHAREYGEVLMILAALIFLFRRDKPGNGLSEGTKKHLSPTAV